MILPAVRKENVLEQLRREILALQGLRVPMENELRETGLGVINQSFPNQTFPVAATHEFISDTAQNGAASSGFIAALLSVLMCKGSCLWVSTRCRIFPPALQAFGVSPDQVVFIDAKTNRDALWIIEEGLKCETLGAVVGEVQELGFTESRRLQLAVEASRTTGFIHRYGGAPTNVACVSRWQIRSSISQGDSLIPGIGFPSWEVELLKIRNGKPGRWLVEWNPGGFHVIQQTERIEHLPARKTG